MATLEKVKKLKADARKRTKQRTDVKNELAAHAIVALSELGYARTGLRDIATLSGRSVGALSYYFDDKTDLIAYCVQLYKQQFVRDIDRAMAVPGGRDEVIRSVTNAFAWAVEHDASKHRLWYDIRSQALFDEAFHPVVEETENRLIAMIERLITAIGGSAGNARSVYFLMDGLFRTHLQAALKGDTLAPAALKSAMEDLLNRLPDTLPGY